MENALIEMPAKRRFAGITLITERIPDETTILAFRHLLEKNDLGEQIFPAVKAHLKERGMAMQQGTILDATLIAAPSSTKNRAGERDPETHQTKNGNQRDHSCAVGYAYGMKVHIGVDKDSGLIHSVETTAANVHDLAPAVELRHGEEEAVYAHAGYQGIEKRPEMDGSHHLPGWPCDQANGASCPRRWMDGWMIGSKRLRVTFAQRVRAKGEHPCRVFNQQFGFQKPRLRGMLKNRCNVNVLAALTCLFLVRQHLLWWTRSGKWCTHRDHL